LNDDWDEISKTVFNGEFSPEECALQFISLPITESLHIRLYTPGIVKAYPSAREGQLLQPTVPTVFQDVSNPLLA